MGVKLGLLHRLKNTGWWFLKTGCWGMYLGPRERRWQGLEETA